MQAPFGFKFGTGFTLLEGDFSRFDGSQTENVRRLSFRIMSSWVDPRHRSRFDAVVDDQFSALCRLPDGTKYFPLGSMLSGAWCTTDGNTLLNAFVTYHALSILGVPRRSRRHLMGVAFGDDGLVRQLVSPFGDRLSDALIESARQLGLRMEVIIRPGGAAGYLSRYYEFSESGILSSCPDLARLLPKFQFSVSPEPDEILRFSKKFSSLLLLCGDTTPVISNYL